MMKKFETKFKTSNIRSYSQDADGLLFNGVRVVCKWIKDIHGYALVDQFGFAHQFSGSYSPVINPDINPTELRNE